jgi:hypothetical protein
MQNRTTPENIITLLPNQIFVFGSNLAGRHGAGAAKQALNFGAKYGICYYLSGNTFAIPTKNEYIQTLPIIDIQYWVYHFIEFAKTYPHLNFLVTKIGCGLAGYTPAEIAPLFKDAINVENIHLPADFWEVLNKQ